MDCPDVPEALLELCRRDEMVVLLAQARQAQNQGNRQAGFVVAWMEEALGLESRPGSKHLKPG